MTEQMPSPMQSIKRVFNPSAIPAPLRRFMVLQPSVAPRPAEKFMLKVRKLLSHIGRRH
jgi:hypothetical protein